MPRLVIAGLSSALAFVAAAGPAAAGPTASPPLRVLVFTKTTGYRHASIPAAVAAVQTLAARDGFTVDATEDAGAFTDQNLARYGAVLFLLTSGDVLDDGQQAAFERYIRGGGGFVGVHSAADTEYDWPWYGGLVGAYFKSHPAIQQATLDVAADPLTAGLPRRWTRTDEWYDFQTPPRGVDVLVTIDETTYDPGPDAMGAGHPITWAHAYDGGRAWYTAMGHTDESYSEPAFLTLLGNGILWAAGRLPAAAPAVPVRIDSLATSVRNGRLTVVARHPRVRHVRRRAARPHGPGARQHAGHGHRHAHRDPRAPAAAGGLAAHARPPRHRDRNDRHGQADDPGRLGLAAGQPPGPGVRRPSASSTPSLRPAGEAITARRAESCDAAAAARGSSGDGSCAGSS